MHDEAPRAEDTDWPQILALYDVLKRISDNPMVALNHAVAAAMVHGPAAGLKLMGRSTATSASRVTTGWTRCAATCWSAPATPGRFRITGGRGGDGEPAGAELPAHQGGATFRPRSLQRGTLGTFGTLAPWPSAP